MARRHPTIIRPFPDHIDRDGFGHWLSGFADGEGCFGIAYQDERPAKNRVCRAATFAITLRRDDQRALELIQSYWRCGVMFPRKAAKIGHPGCDFRVAAICDLKEIVVPHFERYPLYAKKRRDFEVWKRAVDLAYAVKRRRRVSKSGFGGTFPAWSEAEHREFLGYLEALRQTRKFGSSEAILPEPASLDTSQPLLF